MTAEQNPEKEKKLKHVKVYDRLYELIQDGTYPPGCQLPSEPELAALMGVSRMTLRRALALLQEDHLLQNIRGKGNFIKSENSHSVSGMESFRHPVYPCITEDPDQLELAFRLEPPTDFISKNLNRRCAAVVIADRWYKKQDTALAYSLTFLPIEVVSEKKLDLNNQEELKDYLENRIYKEASYSKLAISYSTTGNFTAQKYILSKNDSFIMILESIYGENQNIILLNKHYIPTHLFQLSYQTTPASKEL